MKILIVCQYYNPDPFRLNEVAEGLAEAGNDVTVLTGTPNYISKDVTCNSRCVSKSGEENNVKIIRVPTFKRRGKGKLFLAFNYVTYVVAASIRAVFLKKEYDIVFVYQLSPILMIMPAWVVRKLQKIKIVLYCLDLWPESVVGMGITHNSFIYKIMRRFSIKAYNSVDHLCYTSRKFLDYFREDLKLHQQNYSYIPQFAEDIYSSIKKVPHEGINYVFAGNIGEAQSVETIIRAAALINDQQIKWHIIGDGSSYQKCVNLAKKLHADDRVLFYGRRTIEEMPYYYSKADALIVTLSSNKIISYTLPGKVQSYMAAGLPILVAASGEAYNIINEAKCGLCCLAEDEIGLAKIAKEMVNLDTLSMGEAGKRYYQSHFTKERFINSIAELLTVTIGDNY